MANIYNYWNNVYQKVKKEVLDNPFVVLISLLIFTLPLTHILNSMSAIFFVVVSLLTLRNRKIVFNFALFLPILLYVLMVLSLLWTISFKTSFDAVTKEIPLLLMPFCFMIIPFSRTDLNKILNNYGIIFFGYTIFYLSRAIVKFLIYKDSNVFFYHQLVSLDVNAIHVSVYCVVAFFIFLRKSQKTNCDKMAVVTLLLFIFLLSSKNISIVFLLLLLVYSIFQVTKKSFSIWKIVIAAVVIFIGILSFSKVRERINLDVLGKNNPSSTTHIVTLKEAWTNEKFSPNDFFPGTAFRVYQARLFFDFLKEEPIFWKGFGLNASGAKIKEKANQYNIFQGNGTFDGYQNKNFHNQYIQNFAELGVVGFLLLVIILITTLRNSVKTKDFIHFSFAVLMISLFLTESFLWRQRGIIFFTLFYCLFNAHLHKNKAIEIE